VRADHDGSHPHRVASLGSFDSLASRDCYPGTRLLRHRGPCRPILPTPMQRWSAAAAFARAGPLRRRGPCRRALALAGTPGRIAN